jgi:hypothetical protein
MALRTVARIFPQSRHVSRSVIGRIANAGRVSTNERRVYETHVARSSKVTANGKQFSERVRIWSILPSYLEIKRYQDRTK